MGKGIDWGRGVTNIDLETGIRYGVIYSNEVMSEALNDFEGDYGQPSCPKCGAEGITPLTDLSDDVSFEIDPTKDYACEGCQECFYSDECFPESPYCQVLNDGEYEAQISEDGSIFVFKSPYYTRAVYCSPCAPGACYLTSPDPEGDKAYCLGADFFEDGKTPYPVYKIEDDSLVYEVVEGQ
jgi:hypothetical protein